MTVPVDPPSEQDPRTAELAGNLAALRARIAAAAKAAGRDPDEITLIAVTKTYPAADVVRLAGLGVVDIGENRDQEASGKAAEVGRELAERSEVRGQAAQAGGEVRGQAARAGGDPTAAGAAVRWHFVGGLQRNKCRSVVGYADLVHSVDSVRLATALGTAAQARDRPLEVLVQANIDADPTRGGAAPADLAAVARAVAGQPALRLRGVMAIAPLSWRPEDAFARLAELAAAVRADHPRATILSAGMSGDLEAALAHGATHLRIGTALLGERALLR